MPCAGMTSPICLSGISSTTGIPTRLYEAHEEFDICVFASANLLRRATRGSRSGSIRETEDAGGDHGDRIQRREGSRKTWPAGTLKFLEVLRNKRASSSRGGYFTAEFLREQGMKFVSRRVALALLRPAEIAFARRARPIPIRFLPEDRLRRLSRKRGRYDRRRPRAAETGKRRELRRPGRGGRLQSFLPVDDDLPVYDRASGRITGQTAYKHSEKWQRKHELLVFFDTNQWRSWVSARDLCFGRRFHGCIIGMQAGVPSLMIAVDDRMREMLEFIGFPYMEAAVWNREPDRKAYLASFLSKIDSQAVIDRYSACETNFRMLWRMSGSREQFRESAQRFAARDFSEARNSSSIAPRRLAGRFPHPRMPMKLRRLALASIG